MGYADRGQDLIPTWGSRGRVHWLCHGMCNFFFARSDEVFANGLCLVHPVHCLTRDDVAFFHGGGKLRGLQRSDADRVEVQCAAIKRIRLKWATSWYVHRARLGARVPDWVRAAEPSLLWWDLCRVM